MPMESRRSRKQREVVYQNGIQSNVLKEISTPRPDGSIPLISFLENVNYSIMELYDFNTRISSLEDNEKNTDLEGLVKREEMEGLVKREEMEGLVKKEEMEGLVKKEEIEGLVKREEMEGLVKDVSYKIQSIENKTSNDLLNIKEIASNNKFLDIMKMENDISNQYFTIHTKLDDYVNKQYDKVLGFKKPSIKMFSDNLKKLIETKVISFDDLLEKTRIELKNNVKEISKKIKTKYMNLISHLSKFSDDMSNDIIEKRSDENMRIEIKMKKESCFNNIYIDLKNKYKVTQLSLQTLYINILSEISNMCSFIFGKIEALLQNGSMSDVQLILRVDEFTDNSMNVEEEDIGFDLDIKMNHSNREEYEFDLFKRSKKQEKELLNKTL